MKNSEALVGLCNPTERFGEISVRDNQIHRQNYRTLQVSAKNSEEIKFLKLIKTSLEILKFINNYASGLQAESSRMLCFSFFVTASCCSTRSLLQDPSIV